MAYDTTVVQWWIHHKNIMSLPKPWIWVLNAIAWLGIVPETVIK